MFAVYLIIGYGFIFLLTVTTFVIVYFMAKACYWKSLLLFNENVFQSIQKRQIRGRGMGQNGSKASSVFSTMFQVKKDHLESDDKLGFPASITRFIPRSPSMSGSSFRTTDASPAVKLNIWISRIRPRELFSRKPDNIQFYCERGTPVYEPPLRLWQFVIRRSER